MGVEWLRLQKCELHNVGDVCRKKERRIVGTPLSHYYLRMVHLTLGPYQLYLLSLLYLLYQLCLLYSVSKCQMLFAELYTALREKRELYTALTGTPELYTAFRGKPKLYTALTGKTGTVHCTYRNTRTVHCTVTCSSPEPEGC